MLSEIENLADTCDKGVDVFAEALERALEAESKLNQHAERISEIENMVEESSSGLNRFQNIRVGFLEFLEKLVQLPREIRSRPDLTLHVIPCNSMIIRCRFHA